MPSLTIRGCRALECRTGGTFDQALAAALPDGHRHEQLSPGREDCKGSPLVCAWLPCLQRPASLTAPTGTADTAEVGAECHWHDYATAANITSWEFQMRSDDVRAQRGLVVRGPWGRAAAPLCRAFLPARAGRAGRGPGVARPALLGNRSTSIQQMFVCMLQPCSPARPHSHPRVPLLLPPQASARSRRDWQHIVEHAFGPVERRFPEFRMHR